MIDKQTLFSEKITHPLMGVFYISVLNSNPNGDPQCAGAPRQLPDGYGYITPDSVKRKMRDEIREREATYLAFLQKFGIGEDLAIECFNILCWRGAKMRDFKGMKPADYQNKNWDGRLLGATQLKANEDKDEDKKGEKKGKGEGDDDASYIRASALNMSHPTSIHQIEIVNTLLNVPDKEDKHKAISTFGKRSLVRYGLYACPFEIVPHTCDKSGATRTDLALFYALLPHIYNVFASVGRSMVSVPAMYTFEKKDICAVWSKETLLRLCKPKLRDPKQEYPIGIDDYVFTQPEAVKFVDGAELLEDFVLRPGCSVKSSWLRV